MASIAHQKQVFRLTLAVYVFFVAIVSVKILYIGPGQIPDAAVAYINWWSQQPQSHLERFVGWAGLVAALASIIAALGMALFASWARVLFIVAVAVLIGSEFFMDYPILKTPIENFFDSLAGALSGAIIVFSYCSGITNEFSQSAP